MRALVTYWDHLSQNCRSLVTRPLMRILVYAKLCMMSVWHRYIDRQKGRQFYVQINKRMDGYTDWLSKTYRLTVQQTYNWMYNWHTDRLSNRHTDWKSNRQTGWLSNRQTDWQTNWLTDQKLTRQTNLLTDKNVQDRWTGIQTNRQTQRDRQIETERSVKD
jgi:hypothetical protein